MGCRRRDLGGFRALVGPLKERSAKKGAGLATAAVFVGDLLFLLDKGKPHMGILDTYPSGLPRELGTEIESWQY